MSEEPRSSIGTEYHDTDSNIDRITVKEENKLGEDPNQKVKRLKKVGNLTACLSPVEIFFTIFKGLVGIGILYLPKGFTYSGWLSSVIALIVSGLFTLEGLNRQLLAHEKVGGSYPRLAEKAYGLPLRIFLEVCIVAVQVYLILYVVNLCHWVHHLYCSQP
jgi:hypothetical protein